MSEVDPIASGPRPPRLVRRFLIRLGLLIVVCWGSPAAVAAMWPFLGRLNVQYVILPIAIFAVICHFAGDWVGRFEKDSPRQFAFGCSWAYFLGGLVAMFVFVPVGILCLVAGTLVWIVGYRAARKSVRRSVRLVAENRCLFCEYDLAGLGMVGKCPECGQKFERVRPAADVSP